MTRGSRPAPGAGSADRRQARGFPGSPPWPSRGRRGASGALRPDQARAFASAAAAGSRDWLRLGPRHLRTRASAGVGLPAVGRRGQERRGEPELIEAELGEGRAGGGRVQEGWSRGGGKEETVRGGQGGGRERPEEGREVREGGRRGEAGTDEAAGGEGEEEMGTMLTEPYTCERGPEMKGENRRGRGRRFRLGEERRPSF